MRKEISPFLGFLISWLQRFKVSKLRTSFNVFLEDIDPAVPNLHFMLFGRCCSEIQDFQIYLTDLLDCSAFVFSEILKMLDVRKLNYSEVHISQKGFGLFLKLFEAIWCLQR